MSCWPLLDSMTDPSRWTTMDAWNIHWHLPWFGKKKTNTNIVWNHTVEYWLFFDIVACASSMKGQKSLNTLRSCELPILETLVTGYETNQTKWFSFWNHVDSSTKTKSGFWFRLYNMAKPRINFHFNLYIEAFSTHWGWFMALALPHYIPWDYHHYIIIIVPIMITIITYYHRS